MQYFGWLVDKHNIDTRWQRSYFLVYSLRRLAFVAIGFLVSSDYAGQSLQVLFLMNLANTVYLGSIQAWKEPYWHRLETMNELFVSLVCFYCVCFTDFVSSPER